MSKFHPLPVSKVHRETRDCIAVTFDVPPELRDSFQYQQGQHLTLRALVNDEDLRRSYSICSAVQDGALRVAIKRTPGGMFSSWANESLKAGAVIDVMPPMGHFNVPLQAADNAVEADPDRATVTAFPRFRIPFRRPFRATLDGSSSTGTCAATRVAPSVPTASTSTPFLLLRSRTQSLPSTSSRRA